MAISAGSTLLSTDMQSWYTRLNKVISNYGGGITQLSVPTAGKVVQASDLNTVVNKLNAIKSDAYLGADAWIYNTGYTTVSQGDIIWASKGSSVLTTIARLEAIRCRNNAWYNQGDNNTVNKHGDANSKNNWTNSQSRNGHGNAQSRNGWGNTNNTDYNGYTNWGNADGNSINAWHYDRCYVSGRYNTNTCYYWGQSRGYTNTNSANWWGYTNWVNQWGDSNARNQWTDANSVNRHGDTNSKHNQGDTNSKKVNGWIVDIYNSRTRV